MMTRRDFLVCSLGCVAGARPLLTRGANAAGSTVTRPNVLFIAVDHVRDMGVSPLWGPPTPRTAA